MDAAKLKVLQDEGYQIAPSCGFCEHRSFASPATHWGTCSALSYEHQKHTGPPRQLSIHRAGSCSRFELDRVERDLLGGFGQFFTAAPLLDPPAEAPVVPLVSAADHNVALDVKYDDLARNEARGILRRTLAMDEERPLANIALAIAYADGCIGTVIPNIPSRAVQLLAAVGHLQHLINTKIMEPASEDSAESGPGSA